VKEPCTAKSTRGIDDAPAHAAERIPAITPTTEDWHMTQRTDWSMARTTRSCPATGLFALIAIATASCTSHTNFPPGLEPWETNAAMPPAPAMGMEFPEQLSMVSRYWGDGSSISSVHARGYIDAPVADVARAARDPQTGFDPTASDGLTVLAYDIDPTYTWTYRTHVTTHAFVVVDWFLEWREGVVEGTTDAPTIYAVRWQKVDGNAQIEVMEGSLVLRRVDGHPEITAVEYQYHLKAPLSNAVTVRNYLTSIYGRLRDRSHGRTLDPVVCMECATPPANYQ
jgi:hypothetical protein